MDELQNKGLHGDSATPAAVLQPTDPQPGLVSAKPVTTQSIPLWLIPVSFFVGIAFLVAVLVLVVKIKDPTQSQFIVFRILIALGGAAFSMALTGFITIQLHLPRGGELVAGGALAVFVVLYFFSPAIPGVPKPAPNIDVRGHELASPANASEMEVLRLQDEIMELRQYLETTKYSSSRENLRKGSFLAQNILSFSDSALNPRRQFIKYQYASYAYVDAAAGEVSDDKEKARQHASLAVTNTDKALGLLASANATYSSDPNSRFLVDWVIKDKGQERVLFLRAMALCLLATSKGDDKSLQAQSLATWKEIDASYRLGYPISGTPQLQPCVPSD